MRLLRNLESKSEHKRGVCDEGKVLCSDGSWCIREDYICDGEADCDDGGDEAYCDSACDKGWVECSDGSFCIQEKWKCDGEADCTDGGDEANCGSSGGTAGSANGQCGIAPKYVSGNQQFIVGGYE